MNIILLSSLNLFVQSMFPITFSKVKKSNPFNQTLTVITQVLGFIVLNDSLSNFLFSVPQYSQQPKNMSLLPKIYLESTF